MPRLAVVAVVVVALAAACSGRTDEPAPREAYVAAVASAFTSGNGGPPLAEDVASCLGAALVDVVGVPTLRAAGVSERELADAVDLRSLGVPLPSDAVATLAAAFSGCALGAALEGPFIDAFAEESGGDLSDPARDCVADHASAADIEAGLAATFLDESSGDPGFDAILRAVGACPAAVVELLRNGFERSAGPLSAATARCLAEHVAAHTEQAAATFTEGGPAADAYGALLLEACPALSRRE